MTMLRSIPARLALLTCMVVTTLADQAAACSVCFGDSESAMAKGAAAGVLVLAGIIAFLLLSIASTGILWIHRSRRLVLMEEESNG